MNSLCVRSQKNPTWCLNNCRGKRSVKHRRQEIILSLGLDVLTLFWNLNNPTVCNFMHDINLLVVFSYYSIFIFKGGFQSIPFQINRHVNDPCIIKIWSILCVFFHFAGKTLKGTKQSWFTTMLSLYCVLMFYTSGSLLSSAVYLCRSFTNTSKCIQVHSFKPRHLDLNGRRGCLKWESHNHFFFCRNA